MSLWLQKSHTGLHATYVSPAQLERLCCARDGNARLQSLVEAMVEAGSLRDGRQKTVKLYSVLLFCRKRENLLKVGVSVSRKNSNHTDLWNPKNVRGR